MATTKQRTAAAALIATCIAIPCEGIRQFAYHDDGPGVLTVCYGSTTDVQKGKRYSLEECKARLDADMLTAVNAVEKCAPGLPENVLAAFADAVYNAGPTIACNTAKSTAARMLKSGDLIGACKQLPKWSKTRVMGVLVDLPGLVKRRHKEEEECLHGLEL